MNDKTKNALYTLVAFLAGLVVLKFIFEAVWLISIGGAFLIGAGIAFILIARSRGEHTQDIVEEAVQEIVNPDPDAPKRLVENQLTNLNEQLRLKCESGEIIAETEAVIDLMLEVIPRAIDDSPNSEATFTLKKIATDYLADVVNDYLKLSVPDQKIQKAGFLSELQKLSEMISEARDSLDDGNLDNFEISQAFLKEKTS